MATASNSAKCETHRMRRVLFVGPTGAGKSTLINMLINNAVTKDAMSGPAMAADTASGVTAAFVTYYDLPDNAYTDSVGFGDSRFNPKQTMQSLKSVLQNSSIGYNKIYICVQYGRISTEIRKYIDLIMVIFGINVLKWSSIIFTRCNDQEMTTKEYLSKNVGDPNITKIIGSVNSVIFGDNATDQNPQLETIFKSRRQSFLNRIKQNLDETANEEYFKLRKKGLVEKVRQAMKLFFGRKDKFAVAVDDIISFAKAFADTMSSLHYANYFGVCSICIDDVTDKNKPVITKCHHVYHEQCLIQWVREAGRSDCPVCRAAFDDSTQEFFIPLAINA